MEAAAASQDERRSGQVALFASSSEHGSESTVPEPDVPEWDDTTLARCEKETLGFYITSHPLAPYAPDIERLGVTPTDRLADAGDGPHRTASLAARLAAREACAKLFPRETALGQVAPEDFSVATDNYGAPQVVCGPRAAELLGRHRIASISLSLTHDRASASAMALATRATVSAQVKRPAAIPIAILILLVRLFISHLGIKTNAARVRATPTRVSAEV